MAVKYKTTKSWKITYNEKGEKFRTIAKSKKISFADGAGVHKIKNSLFQRSQRSYFEDWSHEYKQETMDEKLIKTPYDQRL